MAEKPFKDREEVKKEIRVWFIISLVLVCLGLLLASIGIIANELDRTLGLETMSWFLLPIFFSVTAAAPLVKSTVAKSLYGKDSESKNK
jgi:ABC-type polysaccharide/polyol phosphate export permease